MSTSLNSASIPDKKFGSLRYSSNNTPCQENSPDESGRTIPILRAGDNIHIFSSSICRDVSEVLLNDKLLSGTAKIHLHRGRKSPAIRKHVKEHLKNVKTDSIVIVGGGNDLSSRSPEAIADTLINTGIDCVESNIPPEKVHISSVLPRNTFVDKRNKVNDLLREKCEEQGFIFITNDDIILYRHIRSDGVHLTKIGTHRLLHNIVNVLNVDKEGDFEGQSG